jgi:superfamily II DNA helicase RecQ
MATTNTTKERFLSVRYDRPAGGPDRTLADQTRNLPHYSRLVEAVNTRLEDVGKTWKIKPWQAAVAVEILDGKDVVVKAQTGSGKSMCYLALAIAHPDECILVVCPLLALMDDQVQSAIAFGIKAVQLSATTMNGDPKLLERVRQGEYSMVLVSAEFTSSEAWKRLIREDRAGKTSNFAHSLRRIIIDEAHLVREWSVALTLSSNVPGAFSLT